MSAWFLQVTAACHRGFDNTATIDSQTNSGGKNRTKASLLDLLYGKGSMTKGPTTIEDDPTFVGIPMDEFIADSEDLPIENDYHIPGESDQAVSIPDASDQWSKSLRKELAENQDADLRQYDSPIKNQGSTSLCTSFASVAAIENKAKQKSGIDLDLSERHMFSLYGSYSTPRAARATQRSFIAPEDAWPFSQRSQPESMEGRGVAKTAVLSNQLKTTSQMVAELQAGNPLIIGVAIRKPMLLRGAILNKQGSEASIGHAMMAVGVFFDSKFSNEGGGVLVLKNSYGTQRGDGGYVYMPLDFCGSGRRCYAWAVRDVELRNVDAPEAEDIPTESAPGFVGPPQANNAAAQVNPADLAIRVHYTGWTGSQKRFMLGLDGPQAQLGAVASVTFKIHPSFGSNAVEVVNAGSGHFVTSVYRTAYRNWRTHGATVTTVSGERFELPGVLIDF
jgi:C1A family cysteine protease